MHSTFLFNQMFYVNWALKTFWHIKTKCEKYTCLYSSAFIILLGRTNTRQMNQNTPLWNINPFHSLVLGLFVPLDHNLHMRRPPLSTGLVRSAVETRMQTLKQLTFINSILKLLIYENFFFSELKLHTTKSTSIYLQFKNGVRVNRE